MHRFRFLPLFNTPADDGAAVAEPPPADADVVIDGDAFLQTGVADDPYEDLQDTEGTNASADYADLAETTSPGLAAFIAEMNGDEFDPNAEPAPTEPAGIEGEPAPDSEAAVLSAEEVGGTTPEASAADVETAAEADGTTDPPNTANADAEPFLAQLREADPSFIGTSLDDIVTERQTLREAVEAEQRVSRLFDRVAASPRLAAVLTTLMGGEGDITQADEYDALLAAGFDVELPANDPAATEANQRNQMRRLLDQQRQADDAERVQRLQQQAQQRAQSLRLRFAQEHELDEAGMKAVEAKIAPFVQGVEMVPGDASTRVMHPDLLTVLYRGMNYEQALADAKKEARTELIAEQTAAAKQATQKGRRRAIAPSGTGGGRNAPTTRADALRQPRSKAWMNKL